MSNLLNRATVKDVLSWLPLLTWALVKAGKLRVVQSYNDLPVELKQHNAMLGRDLTKACGLYDDECDTIYLIADKITQVNIKSVLNHELYHRAEAVAPQLKSMDSCFNKYLMDRFCLAAQGIGSDIDRSAYRQVMIAKTPVKDQLLEFKAYLITGHNNKQENITGSIFKAFLDVFASIRAILLCFGMPLKNISPSDLNALAMLGAHTDIKFNNRNNIDNTALSASSVYFCFAGQNAETANKEMASFAKLRLEQNEDPEIVRQDTGWFKGNDSQFRFELDDSNATIKPIPNDDRVSYHLNEILQHDKLFDAYPFLMDTWISKSKSGNYYVPGLNHIKIEKTLCQYTNQDDYTKETNTVYKLAEQLNEQGELDDKKEAELEEKLNEISLRLSKEPLLTYFDKSALLHEIQHIIQIYERFAAGGSFALDGLNYHRLPGEVEARNTQARLSLTDEQRRATPISATQDILDSEILVSADDNEEISNRYAL